ncbi:MAG: phosphohistidine phosphatase SixA [Burkholderiales bacterium]|nr:phosphohistidine phosphatase SixA [Burkholderiales bacterium]
MDLILWRHAEAFELREGGDDLARALTPKGERQAARMADWLSRHLTAGTRVLASPARRAQQTARALDRRFKTEPALAPGGSVEGLLAAARWPDARDAVLVVGHQPALGMCTGYLLTGQPVAWALRKGALVWLRARERDGQVQVVLHAAIAPDLL